MLDLGSTGRPIVRLLGPDEHRSSAHLLLDPVVTTLTPQKDVRVLHSPFPSTTEQGMIS